MSLSLVGEGYSRGISVGLRCRNRELWLSEGRGCRSEVLVWHGGRALSESLECLEARVKKN